MSEADKPKNENNTKPATSDSTTPSSKGGEPSVPKKDTVSSSAGSGTTGNGKPAGATASSAKPGSATSSSTSPGSTTTGSAAAGPSPSASPRPEPDTRRSEGGGKGLALLALLIGLAGLGAGGYALMQQQQSADVEQRVEQGLGRYESLPERTRELAQRDDQLASQLRQLEQQMPSPQALQERGRLLADLQSEQQQLRGRVEQVLGSSREQWRLAEAEYLVRMAMLRLSAMQDTQSAIALLNEADLILRRQDDPGAYAAREKLMEGLEALRSLPEIDRTGLFLQLGALQVRVSQLAALAPEFQVGNAAPDQAEQSTWQRWVNEASRYIRIELDSDAQVKPLLAGQSLAQVRLALSLALEQAQWAVLNGNAEVYRQSLSQAVALLEGLFSDDNEQARALARRLQELQEREVAVELPELTPALRALQNYVNEREQTGREQSGAQPAQGGAQEQQSGPNQAPESAQPQPSQPETPAEPTAPQQPQPPAEAPATPEPQAPAGQPATPEGEGQRA